MRALFLLSILVAMSVAAMTAQAQQFNGAPVVNPRLWRYLPDPSRARPVPISPERYGHLNNRELQAQAFLLRDRERQLRADEESLASEMRQRGIPPQ